MKVFRDYALYYDSLYREKNYSAECDFLEKVFLKFSGRKVNTILDLGCGTANHAIPLSKRGFNLVCVDQSKEMLYEAKRKNLEKNTTIDFIMADIRDLDLKKRFDAIILMFAVFSYQLNNSDVQAVFKTIKRHLKPKGVFFFDCWFGPTVISQKPSNRIKKTNLGSEEIIRIAQPILDIMNNTVIVNYDIFKIKSNQTLNIIRENHAVRFFFPKEIYFFANHVGLKILKICPFMSLTKKLSIDDWNMAVVGTNL